MTHETLLLQSIVIIFGLSIAVIFLSERLGLPTIVGFLLTGIIAGPRGLGLVSDVQDVHSLAEIGVVLLLFKIGMKITLSKIAEYKRFFFICGVLQVCFTGLAAFGVAQALARPLGESIFFGFLISLSSTAIVLKLLEDRDEMTSPQGKVMLGVLILQDIAAVMMMLATPYLAAKQIENVDLSVVWEVVKGFLVLLTVFLLAGRLIPKILYYVARSRHRELFMLSILAICFGVAWLASSLGLSLSFGAFLAGMIIAESEYSIEAIGGLVPTQEVFTSFFFVSIGMLFNSEFVLQFPLETLGVTIGVLCLKSSIAALVTILVGMPLRIAILVGMGLSQVGEFSFVLMRFGIDAGIGTDHHYQLFLAVSVITMALTPLMVYLAPSIANFALRLPLPTRLKAGFSPLKTVKAVEPKRDHLIIVGFGFNGHHLARAAKDANIPYTVLEMSADVVHAEKKKGEPIHFGDATHDTVLQHVNIQNARILAVVVNDPLAAFRIVSHARKLNPSLFIISRTRYVHQMTQMYRAGANEVIPDEFGASVEIFTHVLEKYDVPDELIEKNVNAMREEGFALIRHLFRDEKKSSDEDVRLSDAEVLTFHLSERSPFVGKTLAECDLKSKYGVKVMLVGHKGEELSEVDATTQLLAHDLLVVAGSKEGLASVAEVIQ